MNPRSIAHSPLRPELRCVGALLALALALGGCRHLADEHEQRGAQIHYDLGIQNEQAGDVQGAIRELQQALELDDTLAEAHNAYGLLLHLSYRKDEEAIKHYKRALEIRPTFSEVKVNLANVYLSEDRYDAAIKLYQEALNDMLYATPFIAQGNLGWALYKKGDVREGLENIRAAVTTNPKFCSGYRNLGLIAEQQGDLKSACKQFGLFRENCPTVSEASYREGVCSAKLGDLDKAREAFAACVSKTGDAPTHDECRRQLDVLGRGASQASPQGTQNP